MCLAWRIVPKVLSLLASQATPLGGMSEDAARQVPSREI